MTRKQRATLAHLVLAHGYDNLREFWDEYSTQDLPPLEVCEPVLYAWHKRVIDLADKMPIPTRQEMEHSLGL